MKIELNNIDINRLNREKLSYYENYFRDNFNSHFEYNVGTDIILNHIADLGDICNWIDLGAGASTLFWALPLHKVDNIYCNEVAVEPFSILDREILRKNELPNCYLDVLEMFKFDLSHVDYLKSKMKNFHIFDAMKKWSVDSISFDLITQFGTFGLSKDIDAYIRCMDYAFDNLCVGGQMVGANWIFKRDYSIERNIDNHYLNSDIIERFSMSQECTIIENQLINIIDPNYDGILIWKLKKK